MSKVTEFFRSKTGSAVKDLEMDAAISYAKKQSSDVRRVAAVVEPVLATYEAVKDSGSQDVLKDTVYAVAATKLLETAPPPAQTLVASGDNVNPLDFALALIRAPFLQKLKDRTYQVLISTAFAATTGTFAAWQTTGLPIGDKLNLTFVALGAWAAVGTAFTISDKKKDSEIATAAIHAASFEQSEKLRLADNVKAQPQAAVVAVPNVELTPTEPMTDDVASRLTQAAVLEQETNHAER